MVVVVVISVGVVVGGVVVVVVVGDGVVFGGGGSVGAAGVCVGLSRLRHLALHCRPSMCIELKITIA